MIVIEFGGNTLQKPEKPANCNADNLKGSAERNSPGEATDGLAQSLSAPRSQENPSAYLRIWIKKYILNPLGF